MKALASKRRSEGALEVFLRIRAVKGGRCLFRLKQVLKSPVCLHVDQ